MTGTLEEASPPQGPDGDTVDRVVVIEAGQSLRIPALFQQLMGVGDRSGLSIHARCQIVSASASCRRGRGRRAVEPRRLSWWTFGSLGSIRDS